MDPQKNPPGQEPGPAPTPAPPGHDDLFFLEGPQSRTRELLMLGRRLTAAEESAGQASGAGLALLLASPAFQYA